MKTLTILLIFFSSFVFANDFPGKLSGEVTAEYRYYPVEGKYGNTQEHYGSITIRPEYSLSWNNDRNVISIVPFARLDQRDSDRSHYDIRELSLVSSWSFLELRIGISKVFWGVTESQHLVDVVNQTDFVENPDQEHKLGQPMINPVLVTPSGNVEFYILPYFRERTFAGVNGRFRGSVLVDTQHAEFTAEREKQHIDYALRWSADWHNLEWAASYFTGTDRDPFLRFDASTNSLIPVYGQSRQLGLELQYIYKDLLTKAEFLRKNSFANGLYSAATVGFEYTFPNFTNALDIGLLYEWLYDSRDQTSPTAMYDASFFGSRLALNDEASTQVLAGAIFSNDTADLNIFQFEASRRIGQSLSLGIEVHIIGNVPENSMLYQFRSDDYFQTTLSGYF